MKKNDIIQIEYLLQNFDFHKVAKVMEFLNWKWAGVTENDGIPSAYQICEEARRLLENAPQCSSGTISCGGLIATYDKKHDYYTLAFQLENLDTYF